MNDRELIVALANFQWLMRHRGDVGFYPESETVVYGDGGVDMRVLLEPGFTPATEGYGS